MMEATLIRRYFPGPASIVDAGCGFGEWVAFLGILGHRAIGVDYSEELIRRLRETYPDCEWIQSDIRAMPLSSESVDGIISWGVIEHDEAGPGAALREFHRILRPGGIAIVTVPIDSEVARHAGRVREHVPGSEHAFFQYLMTQDELDAAVVEAGFEIVEHGTMPGAHLTFVAPRLSQLLPGLAFRVLNFAAHVLLSWTHRYRVMLFAVVRKPGKGNVAPT